MNREKWLSILRGAAIAFAGGGVPMLLAFLGQVDWPMAAGAFAGAIISTLINAVRKYIEKEPVKANEQ